ncbi:class C beta-lactamase [Pseudomonas sp. BP8]|uniref:class C beta-lactamase n=1 Tax=Pseudomonas sp. BP8 TaxID=2817864 RepID=UPI001AE9D475|nr:class C beta-lactamase [Pseudomonas sp. BP8]MBP2262917.1 beta-lactamase class C [Pseudomonas sp. BP8]HDS1737440.1 beta-lactamase [Pseudomonas putida]HDS1738178.1 beta-lactamase [Pseudomonas putida]
MRHSRICLAVLGLACSFASSQSLADDLQRQVDAIIEPLMREHAVPGMAVAVFANGQPHYFTYGVANKAERQPVSRETVFEVGSLSKTYTATLAALASAEGKLDLDAPASRYQPALANAPLGRASVLEFGAYSADCLPLQFPDEVTTDAQALAFYQAWQPRTEHGTRRCYSNPSLGLFGDLAARAQQQPFAQLMSQSVLPQLGLKHTYLQVPAEAQSLYAQGYDAEDRPVRVNPGVFADEAYGIKTNIVDALHYVRLQLQPETLTPVQQRAIALTHTGYFKVGDMTQSLGWERYAYPVALDTLLKGNGASMVHEPQVTTRLTPASPPQPAAWYNKTGATAGFGAYVAFIPSKGVGIALLANRNYPNEARVEAAYRILSGL